MGSNMEKSDLCYEKIWNTNEIKKSYKTHLRDYYYVKSRRENELEKILSDKDKIGDFEVQKAEVNYGGRNWQHGLPLKFRFQRVPYVLMDYQD